jgi:hypothetical protein
MLIRSKNNLHESATGNTFLSQPTANGTAWVKDTTGWLANYGVQVGETGKARTEVFVMAATKLGGTAVTLNSGSFVYDHPTDTKVYFYPYDKVVFERSTTGTSGAAVAIANGTVAITADEKFTTFEDTTAASGYAYKTKYYNSSLTTSSPESDWILFEGYSDYSLAGIRKRVLDRINADIPDDTINTWVREWQGILNNSALKVNQDYSLGTTSVTFAGTAQEGTITNADFIRPRRCWYTENGSDYFRMSYQRYPEIDPNTTYDPLNPRYYMKGDTVIGRLPFSQSGTITIAYDSSGTALTNDGDLLPLVMRGYTKSFVDYGVSQAYYHHDIYKPEIAKVFEEAANVGKANFLNEITPRQRTAFPEVEMVEIDSQDDNYWLF